MRPTDEMSMGRQGEARNREWVGAENEGQCWLGRGAVTCVREWIAGKAIDRNAVLALHSESTRKAPRHHTDVLWVFRLMKGTQVGGGREAC